jgi:hypothetical protein
MPRLPMRCGRPRLASGKTWTRHGPPRKYYFRGKAHGGQRAGAAGTSDGVAPSFLAPMPLLLLAACAATQTGEVVKAGAPGFWLGLWHGFIFPVAFIVSLFADGVEIYAVPNGGGWYDFGYFVGIVFLGVGARKSVVTVDPGRRRRGAEAAATIDGTVIGEAPRGQGERP